MKTEHQTRIELIDAALKRAGWDVNDPGKVVQEFDIIVDPDQVAEASTPYGGHQFSDYVLLGRDSKPLAVVEAKKTSKDAALGREQAKQYCYNIRRDKGCELPFCFYTNGLEIYFWDLESYPPRKIIGFPSLDDLERFRYIRKNKKSLTDELINIDIAGRDYQIRAIRTVLEAIEHKKRDFLLVMATGTGKTRTAIAMVDALMRAGHVERVLFLVDRIALREQALAAFKEHLPNEPRWPNVGEKIIAKDRRIYIATYPTMLNIIRDASNRLSPHFFDLVVIDESHRSIYNTYGEILDYFKTITLGLTATPTDVIDHNTFKLFACEDGLPTFAYTFEEAVNNTPPYPVQFSGDENPDQIPERRYQQTHHQLGRPEKADSGRQGYRRDQLRRHPAGKAGHQQRHQRPDRQGVHGRVHQGRQRRAAGQNHLLLRLQGPCPPHGRNFRHALSPIPRRTGQGAGF